MRRMDIKQGQSRSTQQEADCIHLYPSRYRCWPTHHGFKCCDHFIHLLFSLLALRRKEQPYHNDIRLVLRKKVFRCRFYMGFVDKVIKKDLIKAMQPSVRQIPSFYFYTATK